MIPITSWNASAFGRRICALTWSRTTSWMLSVAIAVGYISVPIWLKSTCRKHSALTALSIKTWPVGIILRELPSSSTWRNTSENEINVPWTLTMARIHGAHQKLTFKHSALKTAPVQFKSQLQPSSYLSYYFLSFNSNHLILNSMLHSTLVSSWYV